MSRVAEISNISDAKENYPLYDKTNILPQIGNAALIEGKNLVKVINGEVTATLVAGIDVQINAGEYVAIVGPSGSGKSSLLYMLGLLDQPTSGFLAIDNINTTELNEDQRANFRLEKIGYVFQSHFLLAEFTARENVMLPMLRAGKLSKSDAAIRAYQILSDLGLAKEVDRLPRQLSGGQSQRVAIARALANSPAIILADEPTGNLDSVSGKNVQLILRDLAHQQGCAVMVVTHDSEFSRQTDRVISLVDGHLG